MSGIDGDDRRTVDVKLPNGCQSQAGPSQSIAGAKLLRTPKYSAQQQDNTIGEFRTTLNSFGDLNSGYIKLNPSLHDISTCVFETSEKIPTFWSSLLGKIFCTGAACKIIFEPCTIFIKGQTEDTCRAFIVISRFISTGL